MTLFEIVMAKVDNKGGWFDRLSNTELLWIISEILKELSE